MAPHIARLGAYTTNQLAPSFQAQITAWFTRFINASALSLRSLH